LNQTNRDTIRFVKSDIMGSGTIQRAIVWAEKKQHKPSRKSKLMNMRGDK